MSRKQNHIEATRLRLFSLGNIKTKLSLVGLCCYLLLSMNTSLSAKDGYNIKLKIDGVKDTVCYLGYHYGNKIYAEDTFDINSKGVTVLAGEKKLPSGIYTVIIPKQGFFEILIDQEQQEFSIETDTTHYINTMTVKGSELNALFNAYQRVLVNNQKQIGKLKKQKNNLPDAHLDSLDIIDAKMGELNRVINEHRLMVMKQHPETFLATIFRSMKEPVIPEEIQKDKQSAYRYFRAHFWDDIDFTNEGLLRTPILKSKLDFYFERLVPKMPDSICVAAKELIEKTKGNKKVFRYFTANLTYTYETSKTMGMDAVFVCLAEEYYMSGQAYWMDSSKMAKMKERVYRLRPNLIGKQAPQLMLLDTADNKVNLYDVEADFTILYFYSYDCGHCKKSTPKWLDIYHEMKDKNVAVLGIVTKTDKKQWKKFIDKYKLDWINAYDPTGRSRMHAWYDIYSTPTVYVLDKNKKILAKRLGEDQAKQMIEHYRKEAEKELKAKEKGKAK
ncbi:MAG: redoxin domain-containing protein [Chitinophagales bacterium]